MANALPSSIEHAVRLTSVAPHLRQTFSLLPQPLRLDALLPDAPESLSTSTRQLLKLALLGARVRLGAVRTAVDASEHGRAPELSLSVGERAIRLDRGELESDLRALFARVVGALFDGSDAAGILERLAFQSSSLATLRTITSHMLRATDRDLAMTLILAGITSGYGLGFNRAAFFSYDETTGTFHGARAVGPADEAEAHRIWEEIELEDLTIDKVISDLTQGRSDTRLEQRVRAMTMKPTSREGDEPTLALAPDGPVLFERAAIVNPGLAALGCPPEIVLAPVRAHARVIGLFYADNAFSGEPVRSQRTEHVRLYADQAALVWENLSLLAHVAELARTDALTGLVNRRELEARFEHEVSRASRGPMPLSVLLIDVDHFKRVNDEEGHAAGDALLRRLSAILLRSVRGHDVAARYGGDELCLLLPETGAEQAASAAERVGKLAKEAGLSVSIGVSTWPADTDTPERLFEVADAALYRAKREGRGRACAGARSVTF